MSYVDSIDFKQRNITIIGQVLFGVDTRAFVIMMKDKAMDRNKSL
jgi:hypothetical protein